MMWILLMAAVGTFDLMDQSHWQRCETGAILQNNESKELDSLNVRYLGNWQFNKQGSTRPCLDTLRDLMFWPYGGGVDILDISDPSSIERVSVKLSLRQGRISWLFHHDNKLFISMVSAKPYSFAVWNVANVENPYLLCDYLHPSLSRPISIEIKDSLMYATFYDGKLSILDISGIDASIPPQLISQYEPPVLGGAFHMVNDTIAFLYHWRYSQPDSEQGIRILDMRDPLEPVELAFWNEVNAPAGCLLDSSHVLLYVEENMDSFWYDILDISDVTSPHVISRIPAITNSLLLESYRIYAFWDTLEIWDISDLLNPTLLGKQTFASQSGTLEPCLVKDRHLYMVDHLGPMIANDLYYVIDATNALSPFVTCEYSSPILFSALQDIWVESTFAYVVSNTKMGVFDVSNPFFPEALSEWDPDEPVREFFHEIHVKGDYAYAASDSGLYILDVSNPRSVYQVGRLPAILWKIYVGDGYVYAIERKPTELRYRFAIIDVSDPTNPVKIGEYEPPHPENVNLGDLWVQDTIAYFGSRVFYLEGRVIILNVSDPTNPHRIAEYQGEETKDPSAVCVQGNYAYVSNCGHQLGIIDISNPVSPQGVACCSECFGDLHVEDGYAYSNPNGQLYIVDVRDPSSPTCAGYYFGDYCGNHLFVRDKRAYFSCGSGLAVYEFNEAGVEENQDSKCQEQETGLVASPNPFGRHVWIQYHLAATGKVSLKLHDASGRLVRVLVDAHNKAGGHQVSFDRKGLNSGVYFTKLVVRLSPDCSKSDTEEAEYTKTRKLIIL